MARDVQTSNHAGTDGALGNHGRRGYIYANGRYWCFYNTSAQFCFTSSADGGVTWAAPTNIRASTSRNYEDVYLQPGTNFIHYVWNGAGVFGDLFYRRGELQADGTIVWTAAEVSAHNSGAQNYYLPTITVSDAGYATIVTTRAGQAELHRNARNDGTWVDDPNAAPKVLGAGDGGRAIPVNGTEDLIAIWFRNATNTVMAAKYQPGGGIWGATRTVLRATSTGWWMSYCELPDGSGAMVSFIQNVTNVLSYAIFGWVADAWTTEADMDAADVSTVTGELSCDKTGSRIFFFQRLTGAGTIRVRRWSSALGWGAATNWITGEVNLQNIVQVDVHPRSVAGDDRITAFWLTGAASPWQIRFDSYDLPASVSPPKSTPTQKMFGLMFA